MGLPEEHTGLACEAHPLAALAPSVYARQAAPDDALLRALAVVRRASLLHGHRSTVHTAMDRASGSKTAHEAVADAQGALSLGRVPLDLSPENARQLHRSSMGPSGFPDEFEAAATTPVPWLGGSGKASAAGGMGLGFGLGGGVGGGVVRGAWEPATEEASQLCTVRLPASALVQAAKRHATEGAAAAAAAAAGGPAGAAASAAAAGLPSSADMPPATPATVKAHELLNAPLTDDEMVPVSLFEHVLEHPISLPIPGMGMLAMTITRTKSDRDGDSKRRQENQRKQEQQRALGRGARRAKRGRRAGAGAREGLDAAAQARTWAEGAFDALPAALDDPESDDDVPGIADDVMPDPADGPAGRKRAREEDAAGGGRAANPASIGVRVELGPRDRAPLFGGVPEGKSVLAVRTSLGIAPAHPHPTPPGCLLVAVRRVHTRAEDGTEDSVWLGRVVAPVRVWAVGQMQPVAPSLWPFERPTRVLSTALMQLQLLREMVRRASFAPRVAERLAQLAQRPGLGLRFVQNEQRQAAAHAVLRMTQQDGYSLFPWSATRQTLTEVFKGIARQLSDAEDGRHLSTALLSAATSAADALGVASAAELRSAIKHQRQPPRWQSPATADAARKERELLAAVTPAGVARLLALRSGEQVLMDHGVAVMQNPSDAETRLRRLAALADRLNTLAKGDPAAEDPREAPTLASMLSHVAHGAAKQASSSSSSSAAGAAQASQGLRKPQSVPTVVVWAPPEQRARLKLLAARLGRVVRACEAVTALLFATPWAQARDFTSVVHEGKAGQLTLADEGTVRGRTDPSGCGYMLSFTKEPVAQRDVASASRSSRSRRSTAAGPAIDFRKYSVPELVAMLRKQGLPEDSIARMGRWTKVRALKGIVHGLGHDAVALLDIDPMAMAPSRLEKATPQQRLSQKRIQASSIMQKQRRWLARRPRRGAGAFGMAGDGEDDEGEDDDASGSGEESEDSLMLDDDDDDEDDDDVGRAPWTELEAQAAAAEADEGMLARPRRWRAPAARSSSSALAATRENETELVKHHIAAVTGRTASAAEDVAASMSKRKEAAELASMRAERRTTGMPADEPAWLHWARRWGVRVKVLGGSRRLVAAAETKLAQAKEEHRAAVAAGMAGTVAQAAIAAAKAELSRARQGATVPLDDAEAAKRGVPPQLRDAPRTPLLQVKRGRVRPELTAPELTSWMRDAEDSELVQLAGSPPGAALVRRVVRSVNPDGSEQVRVVLVRDRLAVERAWLAERFDVDLRSFGRRKGQTRRGTTDREGPERTLERDRLRRLLRGDSAGLLAQWGMRTWALTEAGNGEPRSVTVMGEECPICEHCGVWGHTRQSHLCPRPRVKGAVRRGADAPAGAAPARGPAPSADSRRGAGRGAAQAASFADGDGDDDDAFDDDDKDDDLLRLARMQGSGQDQRALRQARKAGLIVPLWRSWWQGRRPERRALNMALERSALGVMAATPELSLPSGSRFDPDARDPTMLRVRYKAVSLLYTSKRAFLDDIKLVPSAAGTSKRTAAHATPAAKAERLLAQEHVQDLA